MLLNKEPGTKSGATVSGAYQNQLKKSICCHENHHLSEKLTVDR